MKNVSEIYGIVLAAGASSRMETPKALLELDDGTTLLERQVHMLEGAGCKRIACVLGANAELIRGLDEKVHVDWLLNEKWESGQFTSIQMGLAWMLEEGGSGGLIQPVDVVFERVETVREIVEAAVMTPHLNAIVPAYEERGGHPVYISKDAATELVKIDPDRNDARLDSQISVMPDVIRLKVTDPGILKNVNTQEEWGKIKSEILNTKS